MRLPAEAWIVVVAVAVATGLVLTSRTLVPEPPRTMALPTASELVELERYLDPVDGAGGTQVGVPPRIEIEGSPFGAAPATPGPVLPRLDPGTPAPRWTVTAIMITGSRRVAVVNDALVRPGDRLDDGARIEAVERDHVVLITPDGQRRRLELER